MSVNFNDSEFEAEYARLARDGEIGRWGVLKFSTYFARWGWGRCQLETNDRIQSHLNELKWCGEQLRKSAENYDRLCAELETLKAENQTQAEAIQIMRDALNTYTNYDKGTVRHMDTEFLHPERMAIVKPLKLIGKPYAPEDMHASQIYQDAVFTYGPKQRPGKIAREALTRINKLLKREEGR